MNVYYLCQMGKMKNEHFDKISKGLEVAKLFRTLDNYPVREDFSPILLAEEFYGKFNLSKEDIIKVIRSYYKF